LNEVKHSSTEFKGFVYWSVQIRTKNGIFRGIRVWGFKAFRRRFYLLQISFKFCLVLHRLRHRIKGVLRWTMDCKFH